MKDHVSEVTNDEFLLLSEEEQMDIISNLNEEYEEERVIELLNFKGLENLNSKLLGELARAYNNNYKMAEAIKIMDMITEEERDELFYYRYGYSYAYWDFPIISDEYILKALFMFEKVMAISKEGKLKEGNLKKDKIKNWCFELVEACGMEEVLENNKEKLPLFYEYCKPKMKLSKLNNEGLWC